MSGSRYNWFSGIQGIHHEMNRLLEHFAGSKPLMLHFARRVWEPSVDVYETATDIVVIAELAGIDADNIEVTVNSNKMMIRGERTISDPQNRKNYYQMEISCGPFERIITLPSTIDIDNTRVEYANGLLKITSPRLNELQNQKVTIKVTFKGKGNE